MKFTFPTFRHAPAAVFGTGSFRAVAEATAGQGPLLFMCSGNERVRSLLHGALEKQGVTSSEAREAFKPAGEPTWETIEEAARIIHELRPGTIVAVGGGSVLDWARLAWARAAGHLENPALLSQTLPKDPGAPDFWLVPTTCGTGAEAGNVAVFTTPEGRKAAIISPDFLAARVILDARFLESLVESPGLLSSLVCDTLSHGLEAGMSLVPGYLAKANGAMAVRTVLGNYRVDSANGPDAQVLERLMEAGFLGGIAAGNCSVGIVHAFAHSIGVEGIGHGLANAAALMPGMRFNAPSTQMRQMLGALDLVGVDQLLERLQPIVRDALRQPEAEHLRRILAEQGGRRAVADRMASDTCIRSNPRRATSADLDAFVDAVAQEVAL